MSTQSIQITLHPDAVAAPAQAAAIVCREIIDFYFGALGKSDLSKRPDPPASETFFRFDLTGPNISESERRALHENWILAKAFQDLMRGVRGSLEAAYFFVELVSIGGGVLQVKSNSTIDDLLAPFRESAAKRNFPPLLEQVNSRLEKPLDFSDAYQSMQNARNCLEHRGGVVSKSDADEDGVMRLRFPRVKMFVNENNEEIELQRDVVVRGGAQILMRMDVRVRSFSVGERLTITAADFDEIAFACWHFGGQLAERLPKIG